MHRQALECKGLGQTEVLQDPNWGVPLSRHVQTIQQLDSYCSCPNYRFEFCNVLLTNIHDPCSGHVFSYEALEELNFKAKNYKDLLDDTPFTKNDIIVIQDPRNTTKFNLSSFHHVKNDLKVEDEEDVKKAKTDPRARMRKVNPETKSTLEELDKTYEPDMTKNIHPEREKVQEKADKFNAATWSTGMRGASLTSTAFARVLEMDHAILDESAVKYERVKKKGYVRLQTNMGPINLELHCDVAKKTCENFLKHCQNGYYTGTIFHRYFLA